MRPVSPLLYESLLEDVDFRILGFLKRQRLGIYQDALAEAARIEKETGVPMTVESFKPSHFGWTEYKLPVGATFKSLKDKVRFYPVGIFSTDENFEALKWWRGNKVEYLFDWPVFWVPLKKEKQAVMTPQPVFKTSFTFEVVAAPGAAAKVEAWIIAYIVLPETMREMKVTR